MKRFFALVWILVLLAGGCQTNQGGGTGLAAVEITGHTIRDIVVATRSVMRTHNYVEAPITDGKLIFEKPASARDTAAFGSLMHGEVWERVKMRVANQPNGSVQIDCEVFMVEDKGHRAMEEERRIGVMRQGRYRSLLGEIKAQLEPPPQSKQP